MLVGDAAHPFPASGNGATMAVLGAYTLASMLKLYSTEEALKRYSQK